MKKLVLLALAVVTLVACRQPVEDKPVQVGAVHRDTIQGVPCRVYLPDGVEKGKVDGEKYPVLYLQHGMSGNESDWTVKGNLIGIMDTLLKCGRVKEMVVVMPDNCPSRPSYDEELANATSGKWEAGFAAFMGEAERRYPISSNPAERAIAGLSIGGYHTMMISSLLDGQFAYVGLFSPATLDHKAPTAPKVFWIGIGKDDFLYDMLQDYRQWLDDNKIQYTYYESAGGHDWPNWQDYLSRFLPLCFR